ncbi:lymphocyte cytosolic protein 2-like isoform X2 [Frieseomelitta varia]|uniref:lymphocyte cytosolic protein 2-like isoform X2 n=1 Tax=Frieseomelitta varia TaxID=561572 RepID=UPI001CB67B4C|nr:lymphocyte cytosolic protein 2-like isoform X2 [Frieseomelitta varia]
MLQQLYERAILISIAVDRAGEKFGELMMLWKASRDAVCMPRRQVQWLGGQNRNTLRLAFLKAMLTRQYGSGYTSWCHKSLWTFVEEVKKSPEKFVEEKILESQSNEDHLSDTGSWGTDFEDEANEESVFPEIQRISQPNYEPISNHKASENNADFKQEDIRAEEISRQEEEGTYANCGPVQDDESAYANCQESSTIPLRNTSRLHSQTEKSLAEQLKEQLKFRNTKKPVIATKSEALKGENVEVSVLNVTQPRKSFLHNVSKSKANNPSQKRMSVPPPPQPKKNKDQTIIERSSKDQPKPPATLRNLDLVANLPTRTEESEDEYETFDEQIIEQNQRKNMLKVDSKQSLSSGHQSSAESVYQPPSITSYEEDEEHYKIYESITETPDDSGYYLNPTQKSTNIETPPPLPAKPPQASTTPSPTLNQTDLDKLKERSPDKKSATLPHSNSNTSLSSERATRPLPPPPERQSYVDKPWFHNVTREQATALIKEQSTYGNPQDGHFLLRPSTTNVNNPLALVLWYKDRVYNVPVRKRPDNRYALGSAKVNEKSFSNVEEIVMFYTREELVLHSGGVEMGSTKLTDTPAK